MAHSYILANQNSPTRTTDGQDIKLRGTRDGALFQAPWLQALTLEGRMYGVQFGDANCDPVGAGTFNAGVVDLDAFDYLQTIPETVAVLPVYYEIAFLAIGTVGETGLHVLWGAGGVKHASGITPVPFNMRPGSSNTSACTYSALSDDAGTVIVPAGVICSRICTAVTGAITGMNLVPPWSVMQAGFSPVLDGLSGTGRQIAAWFPAIGGTGYFTSYFAELPIAAVE